MCFQGFYRWTEVKVDDDVAGQEKTMALYRKYLGPEWTPVYEGAGVSVSNH
jgi:hypothetical protein